MRIIIRNFFLKYLLLSNSEYIFFNLVLNFIHFVSSYKSSSLQYILTSKPYGIAFGFFIIINFCEFIIFFTSLKN